MDNRGPIATQHATPRTRPDAPPNSAARAKSKHRPEPAFRRATASRRPRSVRPRRTPVRRSRGRVATRSRGLTSRTAGPGNAVPRYTSRERDGGGRRDLPSRSGILLRPPRARKPKTPPAGGKARTTSPPIGERARRRCVRSSPSRLGGHRPSSNVASRGAGANWYRVRAGTGIRGEAEDDERHGVHPSYGSSRWMVHAVGAALPMPRRRGRGRPAVSAACKGAGEIVRKVIEQGVPCRSGDPDA